MPADFRSPSNAGASGLELNDCVEITFASDEGKTWEEPLRLLDFQGDGGYPSSVQLPDGSVLTAYYASAIKGHGRYHMGVVLWDPDISKKL